ncbi:Modification methylase HpaII [Legionella pneumophila]|nr:Modification methylase HpaII [Legionella pneumophila]
MLVNGERRLTEREMLRLQGFPDTFKIVCNYTQTRKQAGNAVTVNVIDAIAKKLIDSLEMANDMNKIKFHKTFATA